MNQDGSMALFHYWNGLRGNRPAPQRSEIEPVEIKALLPDTFILERNGSGEPVFRLAGTRLCATYGRELKSFSLSSLWREKDQPTVNRLFRQSLEEKAVAVLLFEGVSRERRTNHFEIIILPLEGGRNNPRALGMVLPLLRPFWLATDPVVENRIHSFRLIDPAHASLLNARPSLPVPPLSPDGATLSALEGHGRRIGHLVVFQGGRSG